MATTQKLLEIQKAIDWYLTGMPYAKLAYQSWDAEAKRHYGWLRWQKQKEEKANVLRINSS